jgi:hypothetical protein
MLTTDQIKEIAEQLDCGFSCFINKHKNEMIFTYGDDDDFLDFDDELKEEDAWAIERKKLNDHPDDYFEVEKMESWDSFRLMENFAGSVDSLQLKNDLIYALGQKKPFSRFKNVVDNSGEYRQFWFDFKAETMREWVKEQIDSFNRGLIENGEDE